MAATVERIGVEFDWAVTAQGVRSYKPAEAHFRAALERVDDDRRRLLHAAQSQFHDIRPALEFGLDAVWVNRKGESVAGPPALHIVGDLSELADWLEV